MPMASGRIKAPVSVSRRFGVLRNLLTSTLGNMVCGAMLVGLVYWFGYLRGAERAGNGLDHHPTDGRTVRISRAGRVRMLTVNYRLEGA